MANVALYRKYRSQTFGDLLGQEHVVRTLQNGIRQGQIAHAFLFTGPRGTGKTSSARLLAKALNCERDGPRPEPCNECETCLAITQGNCIDVVEMDAASESGVDEVRENIVEKTEYQPTYCRYKVFIIDEVHDLSAKAFDALLKTIEEPPGHIIFILATTEYNKVPATIRSRCQKFEFHRAEIGDLTRRLAYVAEQEGIETEPAAILAIARMADGGFRDALSLFEQAAITAGGKLTLEHVYDQLGLVREEAVDGILVAIREADVPTLIRLVSEVYRLGRDPNALLGSMMMRLSDLSRAAYGIEIGGGDPSLEANLHATAARIGRGELLRLRTAIAELYKHVRDISLPQIWLEAELIGLTQAPAPAPAATHTAAQVANTPAPAARPAPEPPASPPPRQTEVAVAAPTPSGDPELDAARHIWADTVRNLSAKSKLAATKLSQSTVASFHNNRAEIAMARELDRDWVTENAKRIQLIQDELKLLTGGTEWTLVFVVHKETRKEPEETVAVELPLEGESLAKAAREVFEGV